MIEKFSVAPHFLREDDYFMADDGTVKTVVAKLNLDASTWSDTVKGIRTDLSSLSDMSKAMAELDAQQSTSAASATKDQVTAQKEVTAAKEASSKAAVAGAQAEKVAKESAYQSELTYLKELFAAGSARLTQLREQLGVVHEVGEATKKEAAEQISAMEVIKGLASSVSEGALGGGIFGATAKGLIAGTGIGLGIEAATEGIGKLIEKMKEFVEDSGGLQKVTDTFQKLAQGIGADPTEFLDKLRGATQHLVLDTDLLRTANSFMQSGLKMSSEDMIKLTEATVGLARAQGGDANNAIQLLNRAFLTGRANQLGYITGIQRTLLQVTGLGSTLSEQQKSNLSFAQTIKVIEDRFENLGQPMLTYTDRLKQLKVVQASFFEDTAQAAVKSPGFTVFMEQLGKVIDRFGSLEELSTKVGTAIGDMFGLLTVAMQSITPGLHVIHDLISDIGAGEGGTEGESSKTRTSFKSLADQTAYFNQAMQSTHPILNATIKLVAEMGRTFATTANEFRLLTHTFAAVPAGISAADQALKGGTKNPKDLAKAFWGGASSAGGDAFAQYDATNKQINDNYDKVVASAQAAMILNQKNTPGAVGPPHSVGDPGLARREALAVAKAQQEAQIASAKEMLESIKGQISEETDAYIEMYKKGQLSIADYYKFKDEAAKRSKDAAIQDLIEEAAARKALLDVQVQQNSKFKPEADRQKQAIDSNTAAGISKANTAYYKTLSQDRIQLSNDASAAAIKNINTELETAKTSTAAQADATKAQFDQGIIDGDTYLQARIAQITGLSNLEIQASKDRAAQEMNDQKALAEEAGKRMAAAQQALKQLQDLENNALPQVLKQTNEQFSNALGSNNTLQSINAAGGASITGQSTPDLQRQQQQLLQSQIGSLEQLLQYATPYSDTWFQISDNIQKAVLQVQLLNNEMQNQYALTSQVGGLFGQIASSGKSLFTGTFGKGFISSFGGGAGVLSGATKTNQELTADLAQGKQGKPTDPVMAAAQEAAQHLTSTSDTGATALENFTNALALAVSKINDIIDQLGGKAAGTTNAATAASVLAGAQDTSGNLGLLQSPSLNVGVDGKSIGGSSASGSGGTTNIWGALSTSIKGVVSGQAGSFGQLTSVLTTATKAIGSFAQVIASSTSPLGGAFGGAQAGAGLGQSLGLGSLGTIAGAVGGAALGAIVGQKQQQVQQDIVNIQVAAREMQQAFSAGSASLNSTITTLQGIITTLTAEQSSSKKGSSQFQDLINQYNQQLSQLEAQQTQAIQQLQQQLASVSAPTAYQQWIQNIDSVIQQYSQFAGAAQNATQLAQANEYLTSSLQNIGQQMGDELLQDEESAIQNALQLNQLYNQRNQLELQYLNQVQQIMSQGNLTRQRTQAQSAFSQLYDAQVNYSQQLDSINQQINLAQYQLSVEQQIFNLATTKAGLESQLLTLQEQGVNEDMQRIVALQNLLATMQSTGFSITNLSGLSANDPNALQNTLLQDLVNELNTGQGTMIQQLQSLLNLLSATGGFGVTTAPQVPNASATTSPSPNAVTDVFTALYQSRASFGYGAFKGQNF